jgi:hypothetical protein
MLANKRATIAGVLKQAHIGAANKYKTMNSRARNGLIANANAVEIAADLGS